MHNTSMPTKKILGTQKALLGVLSFGPATGYEIRKFLSETTEHFWKESYGQIYPTLEGLKNESLIAVVDHKTSGRETRRFAIEPQGEAYLREWIRSPQFLCKPGRNELLLKLFFARTDDAPYLEQQVESFRQSNLQLAQSYEDYRQQSDTEEIREDTRKLIATTIDFGEAAAHMQVQWAERTLKLLYSLNPRD
jgi:PadR family transcriptional regulator AphA